MRIGSHRFVALATIRCLFDLNHIDLLYCDFNRESQPGRSGPLAICAFFSLPDKRTWVPFAMGHLQSCRHGACLKSEWPSDTLSSPLLLHFACGSYEFVYNDCTESDAISRRPAQSCHNLRHFSYLAMSSAIAEKWPMPCSQH